eukprot:1976925-Amphidinium_carterae.1
MVGRAGLFPGLSFPAEVSSYGRCIPVRYTGQYYHNMRHGVGTCYFTDESSYSGQWHHNRQDGHGEVL